MGADHGESDDDVIDEMGERGHILWIRGLSRLQHQVNKNSFCCSETVHWAMFDVQYILEMFVLSFKSLKF